MTKRFALPDTLPNPYFTIDAGAAATLTVEVCQIQVAARAKTPTTTEPKSGEDKMPTTEGLFRNYLTSEKLKEMLENTPNEDDEP